MRRLVTALLLLLWSATTPAAGTQYVMRVDGLACPYCAYGIEKKLRQIDGVENIDVDLENGMVSVSTHEGVVLDEARMRQLFKDAGFTYRSMEKRPL